MPVRIRLHTVMGEQRIRSINKLAELTGLSRPTLTELYHERTTRIDLTTLEKLCTGLKCQPGDLLVFEEEKG